MMTQTLDTRGFLKSLDLCLSHLGHFQFFFSEFLFEISALFPKFQKLQ